MKQRVLKGYKVRAEEVRKEIASEQRMF